MLAVPREASPSAQRSQRARTRPTGMGKANTNKGRDGDMAGRFNPDDYVDVAARLGEFHEKFPHGSMESEIVFDDGKRVVIKARASTPVKLDDGTWVEKVGNGHAEEIRGQGNVNKDSAVENCETSAWGRATAALAFAVSRGVASKQEMQKVQRRQAERDEAKPAKVISLAQYTKVKDRLAAKAIPDEKVALVLASLGAESLQTCTPAQAKELLTAVAA